MPKTCIFNQMHLIPSSQKSWYLSWCGAMCLRLRR